MSSFWLPMQEPFPWGKDDLAFYREHKAWNTAMASKLAAEGEHGSAQFYREEAASDQWMIEMETYEDAN